MDEKFNIPTLKKYISNSEYKYISDLIKTKDLKKRIISIFKKSYKEHLIECEEQFDSIKIYGFIGKPKSAKKTRGEQYLFVNNRYVKSNYLGHAIYKSYEGLIEEKKYPFYVLFINLDTEKVDINIHPTKTEIKFDDEKLIYSLVNSTIKKTLDKYNVSPSINFALSSSRSFASTSFISLSQSTLYVLAPAHFPSRSTWPTICSFARGASLCVLLE